MKWLKLLFSSKAKIIGMLDQVEPHIAEKIREYQAEAGKFDPDVLAKKLVDAIQRKLCKLAGVNPADIGL